MLHMRRFLSAGALLFCLLIVTGCGSSKKGSSLKGTVILPPNVKLAQNDLATIGFFQEGEEAGGQAFSSPIGPDMTFVTKGPTGKGVPPGKYKIVFRYQPYKQGDTKQKKFVEDINKKYDATGSRMTYEVTEEPQQSIAIDLGKGTVTKQ